MNRIYIPLFLLTLLTSCTLSKSNKTDDPDFIAYHTKQIISNIPTQKNKEKKPTEKRYIYPIATYRPRLEAFQESQQNPDLADDYIDHPFQLEIPKKLKDEYMLYPHLSLDSIYNDTALVYLYSPLLPTKKQDTFMIQLIFFGYDPYRKNRMRCTFYDYYKKEGKHMKFIERLEYVIHPYSIPYYPRRD